MSRPAPPTARFLWPEALPGVGDRHVVAFTQCVLCRQGTFVAYGGAAVCIDCALATTTPSRLAYRDTLRRWWAMAGQGPQVAREDAVQVTKDLLRLLCEVGEPAAGRLRRRWAREWWQETGLCPWCGERGRRHQIPDLQHP